MEQGKEEAALLSSQFFLCFSLSTSSVTEFKESKKNDRQAPPSLPQRGKKKHVLNSCCILAPCNFIYICIIYVLCRQLKLQNLRPHPPPPHPPLKKIQKKKNLT